MSFSHCATRASLASFLAAALALSRLMMQELGDFAYLALHASMLNGSIACADREVPAIRAAAAEAAAAFRTDGRRSAALGAIADRKRATSNRPIDACVEGAASGAYVAFSRWLRILVAQVSKLLSASKLSVNAYGTVHYRTVRSEHRHHAGRGHELARHRESGLRQRVEVPNFAGDELAERNQWTPLRSVT